jgi:hypothetical protein
MGKGKEQRIRRVYRNWSQGDSMTSKLGSYGKEKVNVNAVGD